MGDLGGMSGAEVAGGLGVEWGEGWPECAGARHFGPTRILLLQYFISRLGNQTDETAFPPNYLQSMFDNFMTLCAMVPLLIFTCLNSFIHQR